jgi:cell wall-associated NlpC family hydrolase
MVISTSMSGHIVTAACSYLAQPYSRGRLDCVHFVITVYHDVGIEIPRFGGVGYPPDDFHLSAHEFYLMPIGHSVFFKRKASLSNRIWTHMAIIVSSDELIHCSRHFGDRVVITQKAEFVETYALAPKLPN